MRTERLLTWGKTAGAAGLAVMLMVSMNGFAQDGMAQGPDGQIERQVVRALDSSKALKRDAIVASTMQGEVTLTGTVANESSRELAETLARQVPGVVKVTNELTIANMPPALDGPGGAVAGNEPPPQSYGQPAPQYGGPAQYGAAPPAASGPVTIAPGTLLEVRTSEPVDSKRAKDGTPVQFTVIRDVSAGGVLAIPRGAVVHGYVSEIKKGGTFEGSSEFGLTLTSLDLGGQSYPLQTDVFKVKGPGKGERTAHNIFGGALLGALVGGVVDRGTGAAIGAAAGAGAGTAASAASPSPDAWIPAEALVDFHLNAPVTVTPVNPQVAMQLAASLYPGDPSLYRRAYNPYGRPYMYGYVYPPVYFRPYYDVGGVYYWR